MTPDELRDLVQRDEDAWNAHDLTALGALMAPNVEFNVPWRPAPVYGRETFLAISARYLRGLPDFRIENIPVAFAEDTVVLRWRVTGTHSGPLELELPLTSSGPRLVELAATGRRLDVPGCSVVAVDGDGLIATIHEYWNQAAIVPQLGIPPMLLSAVRGGFARISGAGAARAASRR